MSKVHIAHIVIEAQTPLKVGSNAMDFLNDAPVQRDWNGLPMILGTSIAGVLRKAYGDGAKKVFGQDEGSKVIISNALLLDEHEKVHEELLLEKSKFLRHFETLPVRQHTAIDHTGTAKNGAKFDEEVVYKGSRFKFSIEYIEDDTEGFEKILNLLGKETLRFGGGMTKGFGKVGVVSVKKAAMDLAEYTSSLNEDIGQEYKPARADTQYTKYTLRIKPDDFFMFGSGFGDKEADMTPVYEQEIDYDKGGLSEKMIFIPASSIKGALAHRTAFYYNKAEAVFADKVSNHDDFTGANNEAVKAIFGHKKEIKEGEELGQKGKVLISDCFKKENASTKTFDHVSIDRFTGGAIEGALFNEKTVADDGEEYEIEILLEKGIADKYTNAFESALNEITTGMLPLGGATTKGHGVFSGSLCKNGVKI